MKKRIWSVLLAVSCLSFWGFAPVCVAGESEEDFVVSFEYDKSFFEETERMDFEDSFFDHTQDIVYITYGEDGSVVDVTVAVRTQEMEDFFERIDNYTATEEEEELYKAIFSGQLQNIPNSFYLKDGKKNKETEEIEYEPAGVIQLGEEKFRHPLKFGAYNDVSTILITLEYQVSSDSPIDTKFLNMSYSLHRVPQVIDESDVIVNISYSGKNAYMKATYNEKTLQQVVYRLRNNGSISHEYK